DLRDAGFLSFFMLVAASAVTFNVSFLFVFVAFLVLGTWMLILHHLAGESERARMGGAELATSGIGPGSPLFRMSLVAAASTFALAGVMFFVIPRVGQATPRGTGPIVRQEIFLDPIGSDAVFAAPKALRIDTSAGAVGLDDMGSIVLPTVSTRLQYSVDSELEQTPPRGLRPGRWPVEG